MQVGTNNFTILVTNISGAAVTGVSNFSIFGSIGASPVSANTWAVTEEGNGFYNLAIDLQSVGQGYLGLTTPSGFVTPDYFDVEVETYDTDSLYSLFLTLQQEGITVITNNYSQATTNPFKEADDIEINYVVPTSITPSLSGWNTFKAELRSPLSLTTSGSSTYIGNGVVTIVDAGTNAVKIDIPSALTLGRVPEGSNTVDLYMDLQGVNPSGKKKTLVEFKIPIIRQITY